MIITFKTCWIRMPTILAFRCYIDRPWIIPVINTPPHRSWQSALAFYLTAILQAKCVRENANHSREVIWSHGNVLSSERVGIRWYEPPPSLPLVTLYMKGWNANPHIGWNCSITALFFFFLFFRHLSYILNVNWYYALHVTVYQVYDMNYDWLIDVTGKIAKYGPDAREVCECNVTAVVVSVELTCGQGTLSRGERCSRACAITRPEGGDGML